MKNSAADMHEKILHSALLVFSRKGYADATIKDISTLAGCNSITIFRHFEDKEKLFYRVVDRFHKIEIDTDLINAQLSYTNFDEDLSILADRFFEIIFKNHDILRIFVNDGAYFEKIHEYVWFVPLPLKTYFVKYLNTIFTAIKTENAGLIAGMFLSFIVRQCLRYSVHDGKWELNAELWKDFKKIIKPNIDFTAAVVMQNFE